MSDTSRQPNPSIPCLFPVLSQERSLRILENENLLVYEIAVLKTIKTQKIFTAVSTIGPVFKGDLVIAETDRGNGLCLVLTGSRIDVIDSTSIRRIVKRIISPSGEVALREKVRENEAHKICRERIEQRNLKMKLVDVEVMKSDNKLVFYFTADGRIDFREIVKDLASVLRSRIEMRQIGVRDETKIIGGTGQCGRELCCRTFLHDFAPVTIKMAKTQGLILNPQKVSGLCGRLLCCISYENNLYDELKNGMPKPGATVETPQGNGTVREIFILSRKIRVQFEQEVFADFDFRQVKLLKGSVYGREVEDEEPESIEEELKKLQE
jgi:cell fate regulator YaaT (PSP1 superfamily)